MGFVLKSLKNLRREISIMDMWMSNFVLHVGILFLKNVALVFFSEFEEKNLDHV